MPHPIAARLLGALDDRLRAGNEGTGSRVRWVVKRGQLGKLKKLLLSRNYQEIDLGVQLAHALADPDMFDALTAGTSIGIRGDMQVLVPNQTFASATLDQWRLYALVSLVAVAPADAEVASLREAITSLRLYAGDGDYRCRTRQRLTYLHLYPNLRALNVWSCSLVDCAALEKLTTLETLELRRCGFDGPVRLAPSVRKVEITRHDWMPDVDVLGDLATWQNVEEIYACRLSLPNPRVLENLTAAQKVSLLDVWPEEPARAVLESLPKLQKLRLR